MITYNIRQRIKKGAVSMMLKTCPVCCGFVAVTLAFASCSDWDDHFDANTAVTESQQASLLTNIKQNGQLNQFADLLEKTGYSSQLDQAQTFTVWAPKDNTFDYDALKNEQNDRVLHQFIENHIARNNYPASGQIDERIYMLNKKVMNFTSDGGYAIQDVALQLPSIGSNNGVIHLLDGKIPFLPNIYESLNNEQFKLDSISKYYHSFDTLILDEYRSVKGPAVDGEITYLDTIYTEQNDLYSMYHAYINREDSSYSMLMPTNDAWEKEYERVKKLFNYPEEFRVRKFVDITTKKDTTIRIVNPAFLQDSITRMWMLKDLFFNNRLYDNQKLADLKNGETLVCDSLVSTTGSIFNATDAAEMLKGSTRVDKSNGNIFVTDELKMPVWYAYCPPVKLEAEYSNWLASYENTYRTPSRKSVTATNRNPDVPGTVSNNYYLEIQPYSSTSDEKVTFYLPNIRSATYHAFAVMVPSNITNRYETEPQPNRFKVYFGYSNTNATSGRLELKEEQMRNTEGSVNFLTDPTKVDTLDLGEVTFPTSYYGLGENYPFIRFESNPRQREHDRTLRIDCIILLPKELYDRFKEDPNYKFIL